MFKVPGKGLGDSGMGIFSLFNDLLRCLFRFPASPGFELGGESFKYEEKDKDGDTQLEYDYKKEHITSGDHTTIVLSLYIASPTPGWLAYTCP